MYADSVEFVAELSGNHNGSKDNLMKLLSSASASGATSIKIQCFRPDTLTAESTLDHFIVSDGPWKDKTLFELYSETYLPWEWYDDLFYEAERLKINLFASVFDEDSAEFISKYNSKRVKIASPELVDLKLISHVSGIFDEIILSTGMASKKEILDAAGIVRNKNKHLTLLQCVSEYPAEPSSYNLKGLNFLSSIADVVGVSDHSMDDTVVIGSVALGARFIEKHFIIDRSKGGIDSHFSLEPNEFFEMTKKVKDVYRACELNDYKESNEDEENKKYRRSLFFNQDLIKGTTIIEEHIKCIRPGLGLHPSKLKNLLGKKILVNVTENQPVLVEQFEQ